MRRKTAPFAAAFFLFLAFSLARSAYAANDPVDVVLLIDVSGSMRFTDSNRAVPKAAIDFIEAIRESGESSRVGFAAFSGEIQETYPLTPVYGDGIGELINALDNLVYWGYTDIGLALLAALDLFGEGGGANKAVVLFTDGMTEISPNKPNRTAADSMKDVAYALEGFAGEVPVYAIGLNDNGSVDAAFLETLAERTMARAFVTRDIDELPAIFDEIRLAICPPIGAVEIPEASGPVEDHPNSDTKPIDAKSDEITDETEQGEPDLGDSLGFPDESQAEPDNADEANEHGGSSEIVSNEEYEKGDINDANPFLRIALPLTLVLIFTSAACLGLYRFFIRNKSGEGAFVGALTVRAILPDGKETAPAEIGLDAQGASVNLGEILKSYIAKAEMGQGAARIDEKIGSVALSSVKSGNEPAIIIANDGACEISDETDTIIIKKRIVWYDGARFSFTETEPSDMSKWEITYRKGQ